MKHILQSQYHASLDMLRGAITQCDDTLWHSTDYHHPFWRVAYHTLFFADLYLAESLERYTPWAKHVDELESLGPMVHKDGKMPKAGPPYSMEDVEEYFRLVSAKVDPSVEALDFEAGSGFFWLDFSKLEVQLYNIRHIQHHTGQLIERIRQNLNLPVRWVIKG